MEQTNHGRSTVLGIPQCPLRTSRLQPPFAYPNMDSSTLSCLCPKSCGKEKKRQCGQGRLSFVLVTIPGHPEHEARGFSPGRPISDDAAQTFCREREFSQRRSLSTGHRAILENSQQPIACLTRGAAKCRDFPSPGKAGRRGR